MRRWQVDDAEVETGVLPPRRVLDHGRDRIDGRRGEPQVRRGHDLVDVAADVGAVLGEDLARPRVVVDRPAGHVPVLRVAGHGPQRALRAGSADDDGRVRPLHRLRLTARLAQLVVRALEVGDLVAQQARDHLERLVEPIEALLERREVDAERIALVLVPAGADAELEPAVRHDVERRRHVREHRRVAVRVAGDQHPEAQPRGRLRQRGERDPALHARSGAIREDRLEVIERPPGLEQVDLIGGLPHGEHLGPRGVLR